MPPVLESLRSLPPPEAAGDALAALAGGTASGMPPWAQQMTETAHGAPWALAAMLVAAAGILLWLLGDRALKGVGVLALGTIGIAAGAAGGAMLGGASATASSGAIGAALGGLLGAALGSVAVGLISRAACIATGSAAGTLIALLLAGPGIASPDDSAPQRVIKIASAQAASAEDLTARLSDDVRDTLRAQLRQRVSQALVSQAADDPAMARQTQSSGQVPSAAPDGLMTSLAIGAAAGGGAGLFASLFFGRWSRRLAAASIGAALAVGGIAAGIALLAPERSHDTTAYAAWWLGGAFFRSLIPGRSKKSKDDHG